MRRPCLLLQTFAVAFILAFAIIPARAQTLSPDLQQKIDKLAMDTLARTGVPSASVAIVKNGQVVYTKAYGDARLAPKTPATPEMRYSIGSISKQFTATAILLLQEQGKLSLNDKVAKFIPNLTRANEVTIRQLLSHTSGYQDYWPQDYVMPHQLRDRRRDRGKGERHVSASVSQSESFYATRNEKRHEHRSGETWRD